MIGEREMTAPYLAVVREEPRSGRIAIADVVVEDRARQDLGDLTDLMESIRTLGVLQAIALAPGNRLLCGARRLESCRRLGMETIPFVRPLDREDAATLLRAERDENTCRKEMTASELVAIGRRLEDLERPAAKERQGHRSDLTSGSAEPEVRSKRTDEVVSEALGTSAGTYKRMKTVVTAAESDPDPEIQEFAKMQLADLDAGRTSPRAAAEAVRDMRRQNIPDEADPLVDAGIDMPPVVQDLPVKTKGPRPNHLKILDRTANSVGGLAIVLDDIHELNDSVNAEEARRIRSDLSKSIRSLNRIINLLKERSSE